MSHTTKTIIATYAATIARMEKEVPTGDWLEVDEAAKLVNLLTDLRLDESLPSAQKGVLTRLIKRATLVYRVWEDAANLKDLKEIELEEIPCAEAKAEARQFRSEEKEVQISHEELFVKSRPDLPAGDKVKMTCVSCWSCGTRLTLVEVCPRCGEDPMNPPLVDERNNMKQLSGEELVKALIDVSVNCEILPQSMVTGQDFMCNPPVEGGRTGLLSVKEKLETAANCDPNFNWALVDQEVDARLQAYIDDEEGMNVNREVDDLEWQQEEILRTQYGDGDKDDQPGWEREFYTAHISATWAVADSAQQRHDRMVLRLAILDELLPDDSRRGEVTDTFIEQVLDDSEEGLKDIRPSKKSVLKKDREVLRKDNAAHFRGLLEDRAVLLRELSFKAEDMQRGKLPRDSDFILLVAKLARRTEVWAKSKFEAKVVKTWSRRALYALFNEAVHVQVALGIYKTGFFKKEWNSEEECSFFSKKTREGMVEVKSGLDWAEELRTGYYEASDGNRHVRHGNMMD